MIKLAFTINREIFCIEIRGSEVWYSDRKWERKVRLIPKDEKFLMKIRMSRNKIPASLLTLFELTKEEIEEYEKNKDSEDKLADVCIRDARKKGATLLKMEKKQEENAKNSEIQENSEEKEKNAENQKNGNS